MKKITSVLILIFILLFLLSGVVSADPISAMSGYEGAASSAKLTSAASTMYGIIMMVGAGVASVMIIVMAIKFMTAEAAEKAQVKKNLIGFVIGVVLLVSVVSVLKVLQAFGKKIPTASRYVRYSI